ncbi:flavoprotein [bacterium]|nr:MAG: flavoprotein [bacterium]
MNAAETLPVVVIGAGPVGLAAAAHLIEKGERPLVLEAGATVAASVLSWGHVKLFSPWRYCVDEAAQRLLEKTGWASPDLESWPTGRELAEGYLLPLSDTPELAPLILTGAKVISVARFGLDKMKNEGRDEAPFILTVEYSDGREETIPARAVVDASGTYTTPNPLGSSGIPAPGEKRAASRILYRIPDLHGSDRLRYAGKRIAVVGSGHSAFNALIELAELRADAPETRIVWILRKIDTKDIYGGEASDELPARGALGGRVRALVDSGSVRLEGGFRIALVEIGSSDVTLMAEDGRRASADEIVATTGFRPNLAMLSELRLDLHVSVESPTVLADMIDPNFHSCGSVEPHGALHLAHPEKGFYIVGMKSYGRAPTFLMLTGYEQVRSIACELTGDHGGARKVELVLPETGVCSGDACCAPPVRKRLVNLARSTQLRQGMGGASGAGCNETAGCC